MINTTPKDDNILEEVIIGYRNMVDERYQYKELRRKYNFPETIDDQMVTRLRDYFLEYIYPNIEKRIELNEAFRSLDDYINHPRKLLRILVDSRKLIWTHGIHLPKILNTGLKAMNTYRAATKFENTLLETALKNQISPPYGRVKIEQLIKSISRKEIEVFIDSCKLLLGTLQDRKQMEHLKEIMSYLIKKMKEKKESYTSNEIRALELGRELLLNGDALFNELTKEDQQRIVDLVIEVERNALDEIYQ